MKKIIATIEKEILKKKSELEHFKSVLAGSVDNLAAYNNAVKGVSPLLEELNKLDKILVFVKNIQDSPIDVEAPKSGKRGRPKKN